MPPHLKILTKSKTNKILQTKNETKLIVMTIFLKNQTKLDTPNLFWVPAQKVWRGIIFAFDRAYRKLVRLKEERPARQAPIFMLGML